MVKIIADTTSSLPAATAEKYGIPLIPQVINFGNDSYLENVDIDNKTFIEKLRQCKELPKTAAPPPELFVREFERLSATGETVLCIHPSTEVSGTVRSAQTAAEGFPNMDIRIIDTRLVASPLGNLVEQAAIWAEEGLDADTIEARIREMIPRARLYVMVDTLEFLARGGRIGGAAAFLGTMLQFKPMITFRDGKVDQLERQRTHRRAIERLIELVRLEYPRDQEGFLTVIHAAVPDEARAVAAKLAEEHHLPEVPIADMPPAIVTHAGPGLVGVTFFVGK